MVIIRGLNWLARVRRARKFLRSTLATAHRHATEELLQAGCDAETAATVTKEENRQAKLQKELKMVDAAVRRAVTKRMKTGWLMSKGVLKSSELRREIKVVQKEWNAQEDAERDSVKLGIVVASNARGERVEAGTGATVLLKNGFTGLLKKGTPGSLPWDDDWGGGDNKVVENNERATMGDENIGRGRSGSMGHGGEIPSGLSVTTSNLSSSAPIPTAGVTQRAEGTPIGKRWKGGKASHSAEAAESEARRRILFRERDLGREIVTHDFDACNPPPLKCCAPGCDRTFTKDKHYIAHWSARIQPGDHQSSSSVARQLCSIDHEGSVTGLSILAPAPTSGLADPSVTLGQPVLIGLAPSAETGHPALGRENVASFHIALVNQKEAEVTGKKDHTEEISAGLDPIADYITRIWGHGQAYNTLMFWRAVGAWRGHVTTGVAYRREAIAIRQLFLDPGASKEASLPMETRQDLMRSLITSDDFEDIALTTQNIGGASEECVQNGSEGGSDRKVEGASVITKSGADIAGLDATDDDMLDGKIEFKRLNTYKVARKQTRGLAAKKTELSSPAAAAITAAAACASTEVGLRPTSFDEAQWQALIHLCRVVGPGFWASDLGQRCTKLRSKDLKRKREVAQEIVQLEVCEGLPL